MIKTDISVMLNCNTACCGLYLASLPAVRCLSSMGQLSFDAPVTFFVGENGTGKSTFLKQSLSPTALTRKDKHRNFNFSTQDSTFLYMNIFSWGEATIQKTVISYAQRAFTISPPISTSLINIRIVPAISSTAMAEYPCTGSLTGKASSL